MEVKVKLWGVLTRAESKRRPDMPRRLAQVGIGRMSPQRPFCNVSWWQFPQITIWYAHYTRCGRAN